MTVPASRDQFQGRWSEVQHAARFPGRLKLIYNTSQVDREAVTRVIDQEIDGAIDVVIDDASHQYELTKAAFENAFAKLRVGGHYIIEAWSWAQYEDRHYYDHWADQEALSSLVLEIALVVGSIGPIKFIDVREWGRASEWGQRSPRISS